MRRTQISVSLSDDDIAGLDDYAKARQWSRSKAAGQLIVEGVRASLKSRPEPSASVSDSPEVPRRGVDLLLAFKRTRGPS